MSRVYYWGRWRHSEDLDFAVVGDMEWGDAARALRDEVPDYLLANAQIHAEPGRGFHTGPTYAQSRIKYIGPLGPSTIKVEMTRSGINGIVADVAVPGCFDCPEFGTGAHSLETVVAEKIRALVERGYARDYCDVWRLLGEKDYDAGTVRRLFAAVCRSRGAEYGIGDIDAEDAAAGLGQYLKLGLARLRPGRLPPVRDLVDGTHRRLEDLLGAGPDS